jgi:hypothetical protein
MAYDLSWSPSAQKDLWTDKTHLQRIKGLLLTGCANPEKSKSQARHHSPANCPFKGSQRSLIFRRAEMSASMPKTEAV